MDTAWLSLGSNIAPEHNLRAAADALRARFGTVRFSPVYRTAAVGFHGAAFLNAAAALQTDLDPNALDAWLHALEDAQGRDRSGPRFSSRTLDIDLLLYGNRVLRGPGNLAVPRPELVQHAFVLRPMVDLAPELLHPLLGRSMAQLLQELDDDAALERTTLQL